MSHARLLSRLSWNASSRAAETYRLLATARAAAWDLSNAAGLPIAASAQAPVGYVVALPDEDARASVNAAAAAEAGASASDDTTAGYTSDEGFFDGFATEEHPEHEHAAPEPDHGAESERERAYAEMEIDSDMEAFRATLVQRMPANSARASPSGSGSGAASGSPPKRSYSSALAFALSSVLSTSRRPPTAGLAAALPATRRGLSFISGPRTSSQIRGSAGPLPVRGVPSRSADVRRLSTLPPRRWFPGRTVPLVFTLVTSHDLATSVDSSSELPFSVEPGRDAFVNALADARSPQDGYVEFFDRPALLRGPGSAAIQRFAI
jgi:hypothetical protein